MDVYKRTQPQGLQWLNRIKRQLLIDAWALTCKHRDCYAETEAPATFAWLATKIRTEGRNR